MKRVVASFSFAIVAACGGGGGLPEDVEVPESCVDPMPGAWSASGGCFGMEMSTEAVVQGCGVEFSNWSMLMSTPAAAIIDGTDVTFFGDGWEDCSGTLSDDGMEIEGTCDDGCDLSMRMTG
jgi:hypothetical protein